MAIDSYFRLSEETRIRFIDENIIAKLPEEERAVARPRAVNIVKNYVGRDEDALDILSHAAEQGRFEEFAARLEAHYDESLRFMHPQARRAARMPGAVKAGLFFRECYEKLGIKQKAVYTL